MDRDQKLAGLFAVFDQIAATDGGTCRAALVTGPAASGKTALMRAFLDGARLRGAAVLEGVASQIFQARPFSTLRLLLDTAPKPAVARAPDLGGLGGLAGVDAHTSSAGSELTALEFCSVVAQLGQTAPVVLCVDDVQHADTASLDLLGYLLHRCGSARLMVLFGERTGLSSQTAALDRSLPYLDGVHRVEVEMLSPAGTARLAAELVGAQAAQSLAEGWHAATGGNPLLILALAKDHLAAADREPDGESVSPAGDSFARAVLHCLRRCDGEIIQIAQALAMIGDNGTPSVLQRLGGISAECVQRAVRVLGSMGLADGCQLRTAAVAEAVRAGLSSADRRELMLRAARCLYEDGTAADVVAALIEEAGGVRAGWAARVFDESARTHLASTDIASAVSHLKLAQQACDDDQQWAAATVALVRAEWRRDPSAAHRHVADLAGAARERRLTGTDLLVPVAYQLWYGQLDDALDLLDRAQDLLPRPAGEDFAAQLDSLRLWMALVYPQADRGAGVRGAPIPAAVLVDQASAAANLASNPDWNPDSGPGSSPGSGPGSSLNPNSDAGLGVRLAQALADRDAMGGSETPLFSGSLSDASLVRAVVSLTVLLYTGRLDEAAQMCGRLRAQASTRRVSTWHAVFCAIQGKIALRQGDPVAAERYVRAALTLVDTAGWGVAIGAPISTLVTALTEQSRLPEAAEVLERELPERMFQTLLGPHFLAARASYHLADGASAAALADFEHCGELLVSWGFDQPGVVPWRLGAAAAHLRLGHRKAARRLLDEQVVALDGRFPRLQARARELAEQLDGRSRGAGTARGGGAGSGAGTGASAGSGSGSSAGSASSSGSGSSAASGSGAGSGSSAGTGSGASTTRAANHHGDRRNSPTDEPATAEVPVPVARKGGLILASDVGSRRCNVSLLSSAERRVVELVSQGKSNREIAVHLFITISTVEQHLTRIYRKLGVSGRGELARELGREFSGSP